MEYIPTSISIPHKQNLFRVFLESLNKIIKGSWDQHVWELMVYNFNLSQYDFE